MVGLTACDGAAFLLGLDVENYCRPNRANARLILPMIGRALRRLPLPASRLLIQPSNGRTLVNFATNFYTESGPLLRRVQVLGRRVTFRITPAEFTWRFADGASTTTTSPGAPYPDLEVTHDYLRKGEVRPRVDTTYTAVFRVGGSGWQPVPGSVTIPGAPVALEVVEARPVLIGYE